MTRPFTLMLVCGEPSGDALGAQLMAALKKLTGGTVKIIGIGGEAMAREGLDSLFDLSATSLMGLQEVVPKIPEVLRRVRRAAAYAVEQRPDAVVLIGQPGFHPSRGPPHQALAPAIPPSIT